MRIIRIGKASSNDIYREFQSDPTVSRVHCEIFIDNENNVFLTDLKSTNGTFVNGTKISSSVMLKKLDIVRAGNSLVKWKEYVYSADKEFEDTIAKENKKPNQEIYNKNISSTKSRSDNLYTAIKVIFTLIAIILLVRFCDSDFGPSYSTMEDKSGSQNTITNEIKPDLPTLSEEKNTNNFDLDDDVIKYCVTPKNGFSPYDAIFGRGIYSNYAENDFLIKNSQSSHAVVLLVNAYSGKKIRNEFIRKGTEFKMTKVPNGTYYLRWVSGNDWCPDIQFGNLTGGFQTNMSFSETENSKDWMKVSGYGGWEVTLYAVIGGDVAIEGINQNEFLN